MCKLAALTLLLLGLSGCATTPEKEFKIKETPVQYSRCLPLFHSAGTT